MLRSLALCSIILLTSRFLTAQNVDSLKIEIEKLLATKNAVVGVAISDQNHAHALSINGDAHFPLQSVFKFHIGLAMLALVDQGKFALDQKIEIRKKDLLPGLYSPLRDQYPNGGSLQLSEIIKYTVSQSDNVGCDLMLRLIGGPQAVEAYFSQLGITDLSIKINEETMQGNWDSQFQNWTSPLAANQVLMRFYENEGQLLSAKSYAFIWQTMRETSTGINRLKAGLPEGTPLAHKTGTSGTHKKTGISAAVNDIGILFLPDGNPVYISVFVSESSEDEVTNEKIIADIARLTWDCFTVRAK